MRSHIGWGGDWAPKRWWIVRSHIDWRKKRVGGHRAVCQCRRWATKEVDRAIPSANKDVGPKGYRL